MIDLEKLYLQKFKDYSNKVDFYKRTSTQKSNNFTNNN